MKNKAKKLTKRAIALIVCLCFLSAIGITALILEILFRVADGIQVWRPDYEMCDLSEILEKEQLTDDDYNILYEQTGLTKIGVDRARERGSDGVRRIQAIQNNYFKEYEVINDWFAPYICTDRIDGSALEIYLENGDIVITSSTHISCYRMGHAGLVTNGNMCRVLEAMAYGTPSFIGNITHFTSRVNFMILTPKTDKQTKNEVAEYAATQLIDKPYNAMTGIFTDKNSVEQTQCAHLVWYAYKQFGIDLDYDGGGFVSPYDLAKSPELELVQVFGFNPKTLWA